MVRQGSFVYRDRVLGSLPLSFCFVISCVEESIFISRHFETKSANKCTYVRGAFCTFSIKKCTLAFRSVIIMYSVRFKPFIVFSPFIRYIHCTFVAYKVRGMEGCVSAYVNKERALRACTSRRGYRRVGVSPIKDSAQSRQELFVSF